MKFYPSAFTNNKSTGFEKFQKKYGSPQGKKPEEKQESSEQQAESNENKKQTFEHDGSQIIQIFQLIST